jgi:hypothetical protein
MDADPKSRLQLMIGYMTLFSENAPTKSDYSQINADNRPSKDINKVCWCDISLGICVPRHAHRIAETCAGVETDSQLECLAIGSHIPAANQQAGRV